MLSRRLLPLAARDGPRRLMAVRCSCEGSMAVSAPLEMVVGEGKRLAEKLRLGRLLEDAYRIKRASSSDLVRSASIRLRLSRPSPISFSKWVMMNQDTRKLQRVTDEVREEYLVFCPRQPRLSFPEEDNSILRKIPKLKDSAENSRLGLTPRKADLDMNKQCHIHWMGSREHASRNNRHP